MKAIVLTGRFRWICAAFLAFGLHAVFLLLFLRVSPKVDVQEAPYLVLDYVVLPPPPRPAPKPAVPKPKPMVEEALKPPVAKAPVEAVPEAPAEPDLVSAPEPEAPIPDLVSDIARLDNKDFGPTENPRPVYPRMARAAGLEGHVVVELLIDEAGKIKSFSILKTAGHQQFALSTAKAVKDWRFPPPRYKGHPVKVRYEYTVIFRLE